jgi:DNA (cytosine-5)-methyltransferase 1
MENAQGERLEGRRDSSERIEPERIGFLSAGSSKFNFWSNSIWLPCTDGKARRIEPEIFPLADGIPGRVGLLRGAGNAIVPELAAEFIMSYLDFEKHFINTP